MSNANNSKLPTYKINPFILFAFVGGFTLAGVVISYFSEMDLGVTRTIVCVGVLFFAIINPIIAIFQHKWLPYFIKSVVSIIALAAITIKSSTLITGESLMSENMYAMTIVASMIFFFMASMLSLLVRTIYTFATESL